MGKNLVFSLLFFAALTGQRVGANPSRVHVAIPSETIISQEPRRQLRDFLRLGQKVALRLNAVKSQYTHKNSWFESAYTTGIAQVLESQKLKSGKFDSTLWALFDDLTSTGNTWLRAGDYAGFAQGIVDYCRLAPAGDSKCSQKLALITTESGALAFAKNVIRTDGKSAPLSYWWTPTMKLADGSLAGYGSRYWQDDTFMIIPWLAMLGSQKLNITDSKLFLSQEYIRNLAYEWVEAYAYDHRRDPNPTSFDATAVNPINDPIPDRFVPTLFDREPAKTLLLNPSNGLWWHQAETHGSNQYWGRGNGWVAAALAKAVGFLDAPYTGRQFRQVPDQTEIKQMLNKMAETLAANRNEFGTWNSDILNRQDYKTPESSGSSFFVYMMAKGINDGWLDSEIYGPVVLKAYYTLLNSVDIDGDLHSIQRVGTGPEGTNFFASDQTLNSNSDDLASNDFNYGVGAFLMATAEMAKLPPELLAHFGSVQTTTITFNTSALGAIYWEPGLIKLPVGSLGGATPVGVMLRSAFLNIEFHEATSEFWITPRSGADATNADDQVAFNALMSALNTKQNQTFSLVIYSKPL